MCLGVNVGECLLREIQLAQYFYNRELPIVILLYGPPSTSFAGWYAIFDLTFLSA